MSTPKITLKITRADGHSSEVATTRAAPPTPAMLAAAEALLEFLSTGAAPPVADADGSDVTAHGVWTPACDELLRRAALLSGTHRHEAAKRAGIKLPLTIWLRTDIEVTWGHLDEWRRVMQDIPVAVLETWTRADVEALAHTKWCDRPAPVIWIGQG